MKLGVPVAEGNTAKIYLYEDKIIKVFKDYLPESEVGYEAGKQRFAHSCGLAVPKILDVCRIDGKQAIVMEYVKGRTLGEIFLENENQADHYIGVSIDVQMRIHRISTDLPELMSEKLSRQIKASRQLNRYEKAGLLKRLDKMEYENRLCHGDFHLNNLMATEGNVFIIIDWVDAAAGDVRADVCRTYLLYAQQSKNLAELYLRLYCEKSGLSTQEILCWEPIIAGARLSENPDELENERLLSIVRREN